MMNKEIVKTNDTNYVFEKLIVEDYSGKPYYSIQYLENGERCVGYSSYSIDIVSGYLKKYFISK